MKPLIWLSIGFLVIFLFLTFVWLIVRFYIKKIKVYEKNRHDLIVAHQKELLKTSIEAQEKERKRIAENLHDDIISQLYRIQLINTNSLIDELIRKEITTIREISHLLSPPFLEQVPFKELIIDFIEPYRKEYKINFTVNSEKTIINNFYKLSIFRIFQEVVTNCNKHAKTDAIEIVWRASKKYICLIIKDNGIGINTKDKKGMGFKNIESRVKTLNGSYAFKKNKPRGTIFIFITKNNPYKNDF